MVTPSVHGAFRGASMLAVALVGLASAPAFAQDAGAEDSSGEDIVVTATLREQSLQDVPFSINAQTAEDIARSGAVTLEDLSRNVAGLSIQNLGPGQSQVSIRGVSAGQIVRDQPGVKEQVGVYLDQSVISLSLFTPDLDLFDLNRVETLRGPQGTLFGSGSVGGTVRYITNQPDLGDFEGAAELNLNQVDGGSMGGAARGMINLPLGDSAALRVVGYYTRYGGFIDARREGGGIDQNVNDGERYGARVALRFEPSDELAITPRFVWQRINSNGFNRQEVYNLFANRFTTTRPQVTFGEREQFLLLGERFEDEIRLGDLTIEWERGGIAVTSVTSYTDRDILVSRDASALTGSVSVDLGYPAAAVLLPSNLRDTTKLTNFTQELRLASTYDSPFQWVFGGFFADQSRDYSQRLPTPGYDAVTDATLGAGTSAAVANGFPANSPYNADLPYDITQLAIFGEGTLEISPQFSVTAGGRYYDFSEERRFISGGLFANGDNRRDRTRSSGFTPRLLASFRPSDDITINAQASRGFRLGGVNDPLNLPLCTAQDAAIFGGYQNYDDETLWNYELGAKVQRRGFSFAAAAFYTDISNLQVTLDAGSCSSRVVFNVPSASTRGVELEMSVEPIDGFELSIAGSYIDSRFDSTVRDGTGAVLGGIRDGNRLPSVPKLQLAATAAYETALSDRANLVLNASYQHVGNRFTQPADQENNPRTFTHNLAFGGAPATAATTLDLRLPAYDLVNLSAGVEFDSGTSITAYVNNLFDENAILAFDRERGGRARLGFHVGQPRTYGVTLRQTF